MIINNFQEIQAWQKARELSIEIYKEFGGIKDFGFKDQITRASVSVMNNIAEGFGRSSSKEFIRFLTFSKASAIEVQSMLILAQDLNYISKEKYTNLIKTTTETQNLIGGFINYLTQFNRKTDQPKNRRTEKPKN